MKDESSSSGEKRGSRRQPRPLPCVVEAADAGKSRAMKALIENISPEGACLRLSGELPSKDVLALTFTVQGSHFEGVLARVAWVKPAGDGLRCGVRFQGDWAPRIQQALQEPGRKGILVIEGEPALRAEIESALSAAGYQMTSAAGAREGLEAFERGAFDLVLIGLALPDGRGTEVLERIRAHPRRSSTPTMILTGDQRMESKLGGLAFGADHYLTLPVDPVELHFWTTALLRRAAYSADAEGVIRFDGGEIDPRSQVAKIGGKEFSNLSHKEFDLLYTLIAGRPKALSRAVLLAKLWHPIVGESTVDVHIARLRQKLGPEGTFRIVAVADKGYRFT